MSQVIRFHNAKAFTGLTGQVKFEEAKILGVSLITSNLEAEGHNLFVDNTTLTQLHALGKEMGQIPVTQNHEGGIEEVNGWIENIRFDGDKLRGDWCLLQTHKDTATMLERAEKQPSTFGLSLAFKGDPKGVLHNGRQCARAEKLLSADVVKRPAANPGGLFSAKDTPSVDNRKIVELNFMPQDPNTTQEPTMADVLAQIQSLTQHVQQLGEVQSQIVGHINQSTENQGDEGLTAEQLEQLHNSSDEQLAELGLTRGEVDAAVSEYNSSVESQGAEGEQSAEGAEQGQGEMATAGAGMETGAPGGATMMHAMHRELIQLKAEINREKSAKKIEAETIQFQEVENKISLLATQRDQAIELAEKVVAENEALKLHIKTGTRPVAVGVDEGVRLFSANGNGELHPFQQRIKQIMLESKVTEGKALLLASKENSALHADWLQSQGRTINA
tara:strand:- start:2198 stop:3535 length:1338 start_codon:yes stop_codon:yes gene_type:complete